MKKFTVASCVLAVLALASTTMAGEVRGPRYANDTVPAEDSVFYNFVFEGGYRSLIEVKGDGDTDLDCYLRDSAGNTVAKDTDSTDHCILTNIPRWTGSFRLEIRNLGSVYNRYHLQTN